MWRFGLRRANANNQFCTVQKLFEQYEKETKHEVSSATQKVKPNIKILSTNEVNNILIPMIDETTDEDLIAEVEDEPQENHDDEKMRSKTLEETKKVNDETNNDLTVLSEVAGDSQISAVKREPLEDQPKKKKKSKKKRNVIHFCPLECGYSCTQDDFTNTQDPLQHMTRIHKVSQSDIRQGLYKFKRVKLEA